jgi:hypothetical protein
MIVTPEVSRIAKVMTDAGICGFAEAEARLRAGRLEVYLDPAYASQPAAQAAALTAVVTGSRCFPGGVWLTGAVGEPLRLPVPLPRTVGQAAARVGASSERLARPSRTVAIGALPDEVRGWAVRAWWDDWMAGFRPAGDTASPGRGRNGLVGAASGALAVGQAFLAEMGDIEAGRTSGAISLWSPGPLYAPQEPGPERFYLPDALWLVGLGNLGQAYLWALSLLLYTEPDRVELLLQDADIVRDVNWGTSILVPFRRYGMLKTRIAEDWALKRRFRVRRIDRFLDATTRRGPLEPPVALAGLDKVAARRFLSNVGFERVIDFGLGATARDYTKFRINVFDPDYCASVHFADVADRSQAARNIKLSAYQQPMAGPPEAACGMAELAGASVAVPFVSVFVASLAVAQAIRIASGRTHVRSIVGGIDNLGALRVSHAPALSSPAVGYAEAIT